MSQEIALRDAALEALNRVPHAYFFKAGPAFVVGVCRGVPFCFALARPIKPALLDRLRRAGFWAAEAKTPQEAVRWVLIKTGLG